MSLIRLLLQEQADSRDYFDCTHFSCLRSLVLALKEKFETFLLKSCPLSSWEFIASTSNFQPFAASHGLKNSVDPDQKASSEATLYSKEGIKI